MLESEVTFIITSGSDDDVLAKIKSLKSIGEYLFSPIQQQNIEDIYLDTEESSLKAHHFALRIRILNDQTFITLKGLDQPNQWGGINRMEIEEPWSQASLENIHSKLKDEGVMIPYEKHFFVQDNPIATITNMQLLVIQKRDTHRTKKDIAIDTIDDSPGKFAELAIDSCKYYVRNNTIKHLEIELEMTSNLYQTHQVPLVNNFMNRYKPIMQIWPHNKLSTGKAINHLYSTGELSSLIRDNKKLDPKAYTLIDQYLSIT